MCGRYTIKTPAERVAHLFDLEEVPAIEPRYNVAPTQNAPVVRVREGRRHLDLLKWGLIPSWAKDRSFGAKAINARAETVAEKPMFRSAFQHRRCLVVTDGFYEWRTVGKSKQPFRIHMNDDRPFAFAGLWDRWTKEGPTVESFTIITTTASDKLKELHERMPVILDRDQFADWLDGTSGQEELRSYSREDLVFGPVSTLVNSVKNDVPECLDGA